MTESMTARERWLALLEGCQPDRTPMDFWGTPETCEKLQRHLRLESMDEVFETLHIDAPVRLRPTYTGPPLAPGTDIYGCRFRRVAHATGAYDECVHAPLAQYSSIEEIESAYRWPSADWFDYSDLDAPLRGREHRPVRAGGSEPFRFYKNLRGDEQAFLDLMLQPELVEHCLGRLYDFAYEHTRRILEALPGRVDIVFVAEDLGSQTGLLYTPDQIRRFFLPQMKRMIELVHEAGAYAFNHSDGAFRPVLADLVEVGFDALNPIQYRCTGMDREGLKRDFGDRLVFHGAVENQQVLPFGSPEDVRREVADNLRLLGRRSGYILAPCHYIQPNTPVENILELYRSGLELG